jgi:hypothetical protein
VPHLAGELGVVDPTSSLPHFFTLPSMNTVSAAVARSDDGRTAGSAQPRGDLVERDQHQIHPLADLDRSDPVLAASQSRAIWLYYETT